MERPVTEAHLTAIESRLNAATPAPLRLGMYDPDKDPVEMFRENLSHGSGPVWLVTAPEHPGTIGGWDDRPAHAVTTCITGNGPTSEANAVFYANAPADIRDLIAEVRALRLMAYRDNVRHA